MRYIYNIITSIKLPLNRKLLVGFIEWCWAFLHRILYVGYSLFDVILRTCALSGAILRCSMWARPIMAARFGEGMMLYQKHGVESVLTGLTELIKYKEDKLLIKSSDFVHWAKNPIRYSVAASSSFLWLELQLFIGQLDVCELEKLRGSSEDYLEVKWGMVPVVLGSRRKKQSPIYIPCCHYTAFEIWIWYSGKRGLQLREK